MSLIQSTPLDLDEVPPDWDALFIGTVRSTSAGHSITRLTLDHHPELTETMAHWIRDEAVRRFPIRQAFLRHRVGAMDPGEVIIVIATWADSKSDADAACRWMLEATKRHLPVWKVEETPSGPRWVEGKPLELPNMETMRCET